MQDVLNRLRSKNTLNTTLIAGALLFLLLAGFFCMLFGSSEVVAAISLKNALSSPNSSTDGVLGRQCIVITVRDGKPFYNENLNMYGDEAPVIVDYAITLGEGKFSVGESYFRVMSETKSDNTVVYAVYDRTSDHNFLVNAGFIVAILYLAAIMVISLIAYFFSARTLRPVEESLKRQRDLVANASHELKTPLTIISTNLSVIQSEPNSTVESNEKWLKSIETQVNRMNGLIQSMLELSKLEQSATPKELLNLSEAVEGACLAFEAVCYEKGATLIPEIQQDITVYGDKNALERLAIILIDNAIKYSGTDGKIGCKLESDGRRVKLTVLNTGQVISDEEAERVFERFYRADGARENPDNQSFGLGLSIAHATVLAHDGTVNCRGIKEKGTVFEVILPAVKKVPTDKSKLNLFPKSEK